VFAVRGYWVSGEEIKRAQGGAGFTTSFLEALGRDGDLLKLIGYDGPGSEQLLVNPPPPNPAPVILTIDSSRAGWWIGQTIRIRGKNFGPDAGKIEVSFGGQMTRASHVMAGGTIINVKVPDKAKDGMLIVFVDGKPSNGVEMNDIWTFRPSTFHP
jgi:hypothetical protein